MTQLLRDLSMDVPYAFRTWMRRPWHTAFAILALAVGIGANTGVFSVVNALLVRSLPFRDPGNLVALHSYIPPDDSAEQFHRWRQQSAYFADAAVTEQGDVNLAGTGGEVRRIHTTQSSWNLFAMLGTPITGRGFLPGEDVEGRNTVAVISYGLWQDLFGGNLAALGSTIRTDGVSLTVVGIAPPGFDYPSKTVLWRPGRFSSGNNGWETIARLKPGVTLEQARPAFEYEAEHRWPGARKANARRNPARILPLRDELAGPTKNASLALLAGVALILLIACTNVANLLMARTADRASEFSVRLALGASRSRLVRQLLTESVLLALVSALIGMVIAFWTTSIASALPSVALSSQAYTILDFRVLGFAIAISIVSGLLFGLLPALHAPRTSAVAVRGATSDRGAAMLRQALVGLQVTLAIVLLAASISVGRAFVGLMNLDHGFDRNALVTVNVSLEGTTHVDAGHRLAYFQQVLDRVRNLPGVRSASATEFLPLYATGFMGAPFNLEGRPAIENSIVVPVLPDYFRTMGPGILWGRDFTGAEIQNNDRVAIISDYFAGEFGAPQNAVGRLIAVGNNPPRKIVGVAKGMDYFTGSKEVRNQVFVPSSNPGGFYSTFVVRVDGRAEERLAMVRDAIQSVDPQVPLFGVKTMDRRFSEAMVQPHFYRTAVGCFAAFALLLVFIGIYGMVAYSVVQRMREMGIRLALGTTPSRLRTILLGQCLLPVALGAVPGVIAATWSGRLLESLVEGAKSADAATYLGSLVFISCVAATATWFASRSISRLDIMDVLRTE